MKTLQRPRLRRDGNITMNFTELGYALDVSGSR
jgi:hypothetical protein